LKKNLWIVVIVAAGMLLFSGCEGKFEDKVSAESMELNTAYTVYPGDEVVPDGPVEFSVKHTLSDDVKTITIVSGSAILLRGDYVLKQ
jgi:hypothetical protein